MQPLQLTEDHKAKLLEMAKTLYSKYKEIHWSTGQQFVGGKTKSDEHIAFGVQREGHLGGTLYNYIHWFEFCHCHLLPKIITGHKNKLQFYIDTFTGNPIDYLYEQFKKLGSKEYKILSFEKGGVIYPNEAQKDYLLRGDHSIWSVQRKSDNEVFTMKEVLANNYQIIEILFNNDKLSFTCKDIEPNISCEGVDYKDIYELKKLK